MNAESQLLTNCTVVDGAEDRPLARAALLIEGGRISLVGPEDQVLPSAPPGVSTVDLGGAYVSPGLFNMHTHFSLGLPGPAGDEVEGLPAHGLALYMAGAARRTLNCGVTSVRCVGEKHGADFALRRAIDSGLVAGPRMFSAGLALACTGGHGHEGGETLCCDGADSFRRGVRSQISLGADLIKVMISGGIAGKHEKIDTPQLTGAEMAAVIETAHAWGRKVTAHAGPAPIIEECVRLGLDCVEHGYQLTPQVTDLMAERGTFLVPTLVVTRCKDFFDSLGVPAWMQSRSLEAGDQHVASYRMALESGVTVMLGSDMPPDQQTEGTNATVLELEHMQSFGLDPRSALRAATSVPATWLGVGDQLGSIRPGYGADLIAMDEDPSKSASAFRTVRWVMKDGSVVRDDRAGLSA